VATVVAFITLLALVRVEGLAVELVADETVRAAKPVPVSGVLLVPTRVQAMKEPWMILSCLSLLKIEVVVAALVARDQLMVASLAVPACVPTGEAPTVTDLGENTKMYAPKATTSVRDNQKMIFLVILVYYPDRRSDRSLIAIMDTRIEYG